MYCELGYSYKAVLFSRSCCSGFSVDFSADVLGANQVPLPLLSMVSMVHPILTSQSFHVCPHSLCLPKSNNSSGSGSKQVQFVSSLYSLEHGSILMACPLTRTDFCHPSTRSHPSGRATLQSSHCLFKCLLCYTKCCSHTGGSQAVGP